MTPLVSIGSELSGGGGVGGGVSEGSVADGSCGMTVLGSVDGLPVDVSGVVCPTEVVPPPPEPVDGAGLCAGCDAFGVVRCMTGSVLAVGRFAR